jgi:hypothetical protein
LIYIILFGSNKSARAFKESSFRDLVAVSLPTTDRENTVGPCLLLLSSVFLDELSNILSLKKKTALK